MRLSRISLFTRLILVLLPTIFTIIPGYATKFRGFWVDTWHSGIESPSATQSLVNYVKGSNGNAIIIEVRKRADAYYSSAIEPLGTNITPQAGYDPLADAITKAHAAGLEVHAWLVTYRVWDSAGGPPHSTPEHIWYQHPDWITQDESGDTLADGSTTSLDPGYPAVEDYLVSTYMDMVNRYDIDGFTMDYIRYLSTSWGYNPVAVARFNSEYGLTGTPSSTDALWQDWRRAQISNFVKRMYLEIKSVKPWVKVGAATWNTAGTGNADYLQNWDEWMKNHWLDYACPMNYTTSNTEFQNNNADSIERAYGHHVYIAPGSYLNTLANNMSQIYDVRETGFPGVALYSYAVPNSGTIDRSGLKSALLSGPWSTAATVPDMPWLSAPTNGYLKGYVRSSTGSAIYPATITVTALSSSTKDSGTGFYGFSEVAPGTYSITASALGYTSVTATVTITAGQVANQSFVLPTDTVSPVISNVRAENIQGTNVQIKWNTDELSTSQAEYGLTASYGKTTAEITTKSLDHVVQLTGLTPNTYYHYRVRSYDTARNMAVSTEYGFTTPPLDVPTDIVIDNMDSGCTTYSTWSTSTSAANKYATNYFWTNTTNTGAYCTWTPSILTSGYYDVYCWYTNGSNRSTKARWATTYMGGSSEIRLNEQANGGQWNLIGAALPFDIGTSGYVRSYANTGDATSMVVVADAVKFVYSSSFTPQVAITAPTTSGTYSTTISTINIAGSATDRDGISSVTWANDRGGSGTCAGTTSWSASNITLQPGSNVITITASDSSENKGTGTITVTLTDSSKPLIAITSPSASPYSTQTAKLSIAGTSSDNIGVTSVSWSNSRGGSGTCSGTTSWSATGISLQPGQNTITATATDAAGNKGTATISVSFTDVTPPVIKITVPTTAATYTTNETSVILKGFATDNVGVTRPTWSNNRGGSGTSAIVNGTWTSSKIALLPGANVLTVTETDSSGNKAAATITVTFVDVTPPVIKITVPTTAATYATTTQTLIVRGFASDNVGVISPTWSSNRGASGVCTIDRGTWATSKIMLQPGANILTVTETDAAGNKSTATITVTYTDVTPPTITRSICTM